MVLVIIIIIIIIIVAVECDQHVFLFGLFVFEILFLAVVIGHSDYGEDEYCLLQLSLAIPHWSNYTRSCDYGEYEYVWSVQLSLAIPTGLITLEVVTMASMSTSGLFNSAWPSPTGLITLEVVTMARMSTYASTQPGHPPLV